MKKKYTYRFNGKGFVLLFVMGALILIVTLFVGISLASREKITQSQADRAVTESEVALRGVMQLVLAKISIDLDLASPGNLVDTGKVKKPSGYAPWVASLQPQRLTHNGEAFRIYVTDARWFPDVNSLSTEEWQRLFTTLGLDASTAEAVAHDIIQKKDRVLAKFGGYQSFDQLFTAFTASPVVQYGSRDDSQLGLLQLITLGTGARSTHPSFTPLEVYKALYNAPDAQLKKLAALRAKGMVTRQQEAELFGPTSQPNPDNAPPALLKVMVAPESITSSLGASAIVGFVAVNGTRARLASEYMFYRE